MRIPLRTTILSSSRFMCFVMIGAPALLSADTAVGGLIFTETFDVSDTVSGATNIGPIAAAAQITGSLGDPFDAIDLFRIEVSSPMLLNATTVGTDPVTGLIDTQLFLFDELGFAVAANDDTADLEFHATLPLQNGTYYLAVTQFGVLPLDAAGNALFPFDEPFEGEFVLSPSIGLLSPIAGAGSLASWSAPVFLEPEASYTISFAAVPEPSSLTLIGIGTLSLAGAWHRRRRCVRC